MYLTYPSENRLLSVNVRKFAMNLMQITLLTEEEARLYIESILWPDGPICPHCGNGNSNIYQLKGKSTRPGLYKCGACSKPFTIRVKSIMQRTHIGFRVWAVAFHLICSAKKGMSALRLQRELGIKQYKTAWYLAHRIRIAMEKHGFRSIARKRLMYKQLPEKTN